MFATSKDHFKFSGNLTLELPIASEILNDLPSCCEAGFQMNSTKYDKLGPLKNIDFM